jgi:molybdopterin molybdotransferase
MVTVAEASSIVLANALRSGETKIPIEEAVGCVLAEEISADRDLPPIDRVTMDGIAIAFEGWKNGAREFKVSGVQAAGMAQQDLGALDACLEVMTGASMPRGADTVIPYEELRVKDAVAFVESPNVVRGQNIHRKGSDAQSGAMLLQPGIVISPAEVALLATVGKTHVSVFRFPSAAIVSTGDELVPIGSVPAPHQVRRSNTYAILAAMRSMGWSAESFHLPDNPEVLSGKLKEILANHDVVILSGGVSKGKFDFVPGALEANGIAKRFHRVNQRPGKPFWFGTSPDGRKTVFALPGNPVSTYLCFYRYVRPWIRRCHQADEAPLFARLASDFTPPAGTTYFLQVSVKNEQGVCMAHPDAGGGSGDLANLKDVTGFLEIDGSQGTGRKGQVFRYFPFRY